MTHVTDEDRDWLRARGLLPRSGVRGWFLGLWRSHRGHRKAAIAGGESAETQAGPSSLQAQGNTES